MIYSSRGHGRLAVCLLLTIAVRGASAAPRIFWASTPVRPDETVLLQGSGLTEVGSKIELARLPDDMHSAGEAEIKDWTPVPELQAGVQSLKFVVPGAWQSGVYACRVTAGDSASPITYLNAPEPWWVQGDEGEAATPGGWLRVLGKSLDHDHRSSARLESESTPAIDLRTRSADAFSLGFDLPADLKPGRYAVRVHNGLGGAAAWRTAGMLQVIPPVVFPKNVFSVLDFYGPDAARDMRKTLIKYNQPLDRTEGILAALAKAKENGGGTVYFPPGRYTVKGPLVVPDHTVLKGEGMGVVTLWWGSGHFNLDGGGPQGRALIDEPKPPHTLIYGKDFGIEDMSLYLPLHYEEGLVADTRFRMRRVRVRIDHYWMVQGRGDGDVARLGDNFQVTDCDILAKGTALVSGRYGLIANNCVMANKTNTPLGGSRQVIVENNHFVGMDPTAYQNISGVGRNLYYAHNLQENLYAQQADYSFTFDAGTGAYFGKIDPPTGTHLTLAADPAFPKWAPEKDRLWQSAVVCVLDGTGAGQWRNVTSHHGREWEIDRPFDSAPDATSVISIVPFNGRVLVVGNRFEDGNWVNAGYGTSIDVVYADNVLARCAELMNYGLASHDALQPSWYVQYLDNRVTEGQTNISSTGGGHASELYTGPLTCWCIHRRETLAADNSGSISISGKVRDAIVEGCAANNPNGVIKVQGDPQAVLLRNNTFPGSSAPRYEGIAGRETLVVPAPGR